MTWILAIGFLITSLTLTVIAANNAGGSSVLDLPVGAVGEEGAAIDPNAILIPDLGNLPTGGSDAAGTPPAATQTAPATPPVSE